MSETFLIKTTSFDSSGTITEREANSFIIGPGELNGPGGATRDSDLKLFGFGALKWGEGVNQNLFRILGNNSCPEKVLNDYNPATGNNDYDPVTDPLLPKDENDLGIGNGITVPVVGQNWFNTTDNATYVYLITGWISLLGGAGSLSLNGILDMNTNRIHNVADPIDATDAMSQGYADGRYLKLDGTVPMAGILNMGGANRIIGVVDPINPNDALTLGFADGRYIQSGSGGTTTADLNMNSFLIKNLGNPITGTDGINRDYADSRYVNITGDTITGGGLTVNGGLSSRGSNLTVTNNATSRTINLGFNATNNNNYEMVLFGTTNPVLLLKAGVGDSQLTVDNLLATNQIAIGSTQIFPTSISTLQVSSSQNMICNGDLYVGFGSGNSSILFNDGNSSTTRQMIWNDLSNEFQVEDNTGTLRPLLHSGNVTSFVNSPTFQAANNANRIVNSNFFGNFTLNYTNGGVPTTGVNWVLLYLTIQINNETNPSLFYTHTSGVLNGFKIITGNVSGGGGGSFPEAATEVAQAWVPYTSTSYVVSVSGDNPGGTVAVHVIGWM